MAKKAAPKESGQDASPKAKRPRAKAARAKASTGGSPLGVTIRMYCQGLGDCFLLTFPGDAKAEPARVLIDCGVFLNTPGEAPRLRAVADDIREETGGKIDLLIVTHEHWDHIAGFSHANEVFANEFEFGAVWLSWAENPDDADARAVKATLGKKKAQLRAALEAARVNPGLVGADQLPEDLESAVSVLGFFGPEEAAAGPSGLAAAAKAGAGPTRMDLGTTMDWLRQKVGAKDFCSPGQRRAVPGAAGVHAYIFGPPRDSSQIRKMNPTGDQGYGLMAADQISFLRAVESLLPDGGAEGAPPAPFEGRFRLAPEEAKLDPFFRRRYGFPGDPLSDPGAEWRRIDFDWLIGGLSRLALQLDVGVNNTSLALAFELPDGRTLIFPGDAQIGNWLSWGGLKFRVNDPNGREVEVTPKDLLNRAIFYKVGHHGSHNATLKAGGLEEMTGGDLVAMIPTDQAYARTKRPPKTGWEMPAHGVHEALRGSTHGRIIRADHKSFDEIEADVDERTRGSRSWSDFRGRVAFAGRFPDDAQKPDAPLFVEYEIPYLAKSRT